MGLEWTFGRFVAGCRVDLIGSVQRSVAGSCECGDEPSGSVAMDLINSGYFNTLGWNGGSSRERTTLMAETHPFYTGKGRLWFS
jgi:hypothetical protein